MKSEYIYKKKDLKLTRNIMIVLIALICVSLPLTAYLVMEFMDNNYIKVYQKYIEEDSDSVCNSQFFEVTKKVDNFCYKTNIDNLIIGSNITGAKSIEELRGNMSLYSTSPSGTGLNEMVLEKEIECPLIVAGRQSYEKGEFYSYKECLISFLCVGDFNGTVYKKSGLFCWKNGELIEYERGFG